MSFELNSAVLRLFQQDETVLVTPKVLEARLPLLATRPQLLICTTIFNKKCTNDKLTK